MNDRSQMTEVRGQNTEDRIQKKEDGYGEYRNLRSIRPCSGQALLKTGFAGMTMGKWGQ